MQQRLVGILLIGFALALSTGAAAEAASKSASWIHYETIHFPGTKGFDFKVGLIGVRGPTHSISVGTVKARRGPEAGEYPKVDSSRLAADGSASLRIPGAGRIDLSFQSDQDEEMPLLTLCPGSPATFTRGTFSGNVDLRGRRGFTTAHRTHADGNLIDLGSLTCLLPTEPGAKGRPAIPLLRGVEEASPGAPFPAAGVRAERRVPDRITTFSAGEVSLDGGETLGPIYLARAATHVHGVPFVGSSRSVEEGSIFSGPSLKQRTPVTIEPFSAFSGQGNFELLSSQKATFTGDLSAELPGFGEVSLAGPKFKAAVCEDDRCIGNAEPLDENELLDLPTFGLAPSGRFP